jgi:hypothetical protein
MGSIHEKNQRSTISCYCTFKEELLTQPQHTLCCGQKGFTFIIDIWTSVFSVLHLTRFSNDIPRRRKKLSHINQLQYVKVFKQTCQHGYFHHKILLNVLYIL